jgi:hypothetical protein
MVSIAHTDPAQHASQMQQCILHVLIYVGVMCLLGAVAALAGSWGWFISAAAGWGIVLIAQTTYVFVFQRAVSGEKEEDKAIQEVAAA